MISPTAAEPGAEPVTGRFAPGRIQRFLYILSFIIVKLHLTTFIKANDDDDPAYSVKTQVPGAKRLGAKRPGGELTKGRNVHKSRSHSEKMKAGHMFCFYPKL